MLSDDSSSDSETGRFKCRSKPENEQGSKYKDDNTRSSARDRNVESNRFRRDIDRRKDERNNIGKDDRDRYRRSRRSPLPRRRYSRDRSPARRNAHERRHSRDRSLNRRSQEEHRHRRELKSNSKLTHHRSTSKDRHRHSRSRSKRKDLVDDKKNCDKFTRYERDSDSPSPNHREKRSEVFRAPPSTSIKRKSESPINLEEHSDIDDIEKIKPGSYYNMIPTVVKDKSEESSEIDSSDDEKLRAKLLNLEKKLHKTKKKKRRKKHKRKSSKSNEREPDPASVEVTSTTDIEDKSKTDPITQTEAAAEVTSTQKMVQKESSEEGEISTDDDSQKEIDIDPNDLRHKLKRSKQGSSSQEREGPILPPHLKVQLGRRTSPSVEGPALPPHLQRRPGNIGPTIPDDIRKVLAENEREIIKYEVSDEEDIGPLPAGSEDKWTDAHKRLEVRALNMKIRQLDGHSLKSHQVKSREQWMLELPEGKAKYIGLEARSFRAKEGPDMSDRSSWTDTPEEKARKEAGIVKEEDADVILKREAKARQISNRDTEQEDAVRKHKKKHKREESLLDIHQKKLKKKKKKDDKGEEKKERRPFSRDVDLQVNRFDEAQKRSIIKKAQDLDGRFSKGEAKFL